MKRLLVAVALLVGIVGFSAMAITVSHGWQGCGTYVISVSGIPEIQQPEFDSSLFDFINMSRTPWDAGKDDVSLHHLFIGSNNYTFDEVGIDVLSFVPYESISLSIPSTWNGTTLIAQGDRIEVYARWYDEDPIDTITVGPCGGGSDIALTRVPAPNLRVALTMDEKGMTATLTNTGDLSATIPLAGVVFALTPKVDWQPESDPNIRWQSDPLLEGTLTIGPNETKTITFPTPDLPASVLTAYNQMVSFWYPQYLGSQIHIAVGFPFGGGMAWGWFASAWTP